MPNFTGLWTAAQQSQADGAGIWPNVSGAPTIGTATATSGTSASVTFTAPSSAGYPATITGYIVTSSPEGLTGTGASSPVSVTGLTAGTAYTFTVRAINATGTGPASAASNSVTPVDTFVEDVFSTFTYTGNSDARTITNGIDLAGKGGLVWMKARTNTYPHALYDTQRGILPTLETNSNSPNSTNYGITSFNSNGWSMYTATGRSNNSAENYVSWTFREQAKFFDIVTWTGNGTAGREIAHNLGSTPGCIIVKVTDNNGGWMVYHRSLGATKFLELNETNAEQTSNLPWNNTTPTSSVFTVGTTNTNETGRNYVAYLFAHDAGGFGLTGADNIISCGSFTTNGSAKAVVNLGYEPQWILYKRNEAGEDWYIADNMRGWQSDGTLQRLEANTTDIEANTPSNLGITATGFETFGNAGASKTYYYIAIRRPMKVPTVGTTVYNAIARTGTAATAQVTGVGFSPDLAMFQHRGATNGNILFDKLRGLNQSLSSSSSGTESAETGALTSYNMDGVTLGDNSSGNRTNWNTFSYINHFFKRAPGFFDEVCYTGTGSARTISHNLAAVPELIITKTRAAASGYNYWFVYHKDIGQTFQLLLNGTNARDDGWGSPYTSTPPTSSVFSISSGIQINESGVTHVSYLFATCPGVSKVGSYTGTATTNQIDCGFTAGARFVLIKRTDSTGDWYVWDTVRGIISGNDPYVLWNSTAAEVTNTDYIDTYSAGFELSSTAPAALNANGGTYIFLAIA